MVLMAEATLVASVVKALGGDIGRTWRRAAAERGPRRRAGYERLLARSADCHEVERREREWNRRDARDGSLLGD